MVNFSKEIEKKTSAPNSPALRARRGEHQIAPSPLSPRYVLDATAAKLEKEADAKGSTTITPAPASAVAPPPPAAESPASTSAATTPRKSDAATAAAAAGSDAAKPTAAAATEDASAAPRASRRCRGFGHPAPSPSSTPSPRPSPLYVAASPPFLLISQPAPLPNRNARLRRHLLLTSLPEHLRLVRP